MKVNFNDIENFMQFYNQVKDEPFSFQTAYKLSKLFNVFEKEIGFFSETMQKIIDTYAQKNDKGEYLYSEDGKSILIVEEKRDECQIKLNELQEVQVEITDNINFDISEFENIKLSPQSVNILIKFIKKETLN